MNKLPLNSVIYIAGHRGLVGSALLRKLQHMGYSSLLLRTHVELDLTQQSQVRAFFQKYRPDYVFLAAAKVGGIHANNSYPVDFIQNNLQIQTNVIEAAYRTEVKKLLFLGSSCIYPKAAPQPLQEQALLTGPLEETNEWYAVAKIAGIKLCQAYYRQYGFQAISAMPTNLYGPEDNFHLANSHVLPALIRKFHEAKQQDQPKVTVWGTGTPTREFLHVDDLADASLFLMENYHSPEIINVGYGEEISIRELAQLVGKIVGYVGELEFDHSKPDGVPRKMVDCSRLQQLGWMPKISLQTGIASVYEWFLAHQDRFRQ